MTYPRPQLRRRLWQSLDGEWTLNGAPCTVPACRTEETLIYEKRFSYTFDAPRAMLHFMAVDQIAKVYLNGVFLGEHIGGYLPFSFDVSSTILRGENLLRVEVTDTLDHTYPYGKQRIDRGGMWYTPVSGIWQSVWIEPLPARYISDVRITPDLAGVNLEVRITDGTETTVRRTRIDVEDPEPWTPAHPKLYTHTLSVGDDEAEIYYALRTVDIREIDGIRRVCLNGEPIFLHGVLDQGYFGDGLFIPPEPEEYERDILRMKELGFNLLRKHIKIEPESFYYACDRLGMLVMQDMVNSGDYSFFRDTVLGTLGLPLSDRVERLDARKTFFIAHSRETVEHLYNHPAVIAYTIFNEGWGQFNSDERYNELKSLDPTRLYDSTSGWFRQKESDFDSLHIYFRLKKLAPKTRPLFISECGGYSLNLNGRGKTYGYGSCASKHELTEKIAKLYDTMILPAVKNGCCGCIYTQLSDIEDEINGLYSSDHSECKVEKDAMRAIAERLNNALRTALRHE